ncbi:ABC transporter ATP-binding protein [Microvirga antarctica]|uniref:ABC transporter ATP-binding protein n=1 Tax=Microvirga antarctica TaxID=2819233 RepID=UPI001B3090E7|nr:ABC transporter ATP-binding protein [Microvirga antarctica]
MNAAEPVLAMRDVAIEIGGARVVDGVSITASAGRIVALVGESGCGKSLTALSILRLLPKAARFTGGTVELGGRVLSAMSEEQLAGVRGDEVAIIFQEPIASLNPLMRAGEQVEEALRLHRGLGSAEARREAIAMMTRVGISDAERRAEQYPFELSGGMCQRIMIAAALICRPKLLIADEPTTALDVTIQAQILDLMRDLRQSAGTAILVITHDMGVVADLADDVCIMYGGRIVESGPVDAIFEEPRHPYTKLLLATIPKLDGPRKVDLKTIAGVVPAAGTWPDGCRFRNRCPLADEACATVPPLVEVGPDHDTACWHSTRVAELA